MVGLVIGHERSFAAYFSATSCPKAVFGPKRRALCAEAVPEARSQETAIAGPVQPCWRTALIADSEPSRDIQLQSDLFMLPQEVLERVLRFCGPKELATLEATSRFFVSSSLVQRVAEEQLISIPRARDFAPEKGETWLTLSRFAKSQGEGAAQSTALSLGSYHTAAILSSNACRHGHVLALFGRGFHGQLGHGSFESAFSPQAHLKGSNILIGGLSSQHALVVRPAVIACGSEHTAAISSRGQLFTWGLAGSGETGRIDAQPADAALPRPVYPWQAARMVSICAGSHHSLLISELGELWSCGRGSHGQLGVNDYRDAFQLQRVHLRCAGMVAVAAGDSHSVALSADGTVWTWGCGSSGQLGHEAVGIVLGTHPGVPISMPLPQAICALNPAKLPPASRVTAIAAGANHTLLLTVGGSLLACGGNKYGCLGLGNADNQLVPTEVALGHLRGDARAPVRVVQMACGRAHSLVLAHCAGRTIVCSAGYNFFGQLGVGDTLERKIFTRIPSLSGKPIVAISSGDQHCAAVSVTGELYVWGRGDCGQLGLGSDRNESTPTLLPRVQIVHPNITLRRSDPPHAFQSAEQAEA